MNPNLIMASAFVAFFAFGAGYFARGVICEAPPDIPPPPPRRRVYVWFVTWRNHGISVESQVACKFPDKDSACSDILRRLQSTAPGSEIVSLYLSHETIV